MNPHDYRLFHITIPLLIILHAFESDNFFYYCIKHTTISIRLIYFQHKCFFVKIFYVIILNIKLISHGIYLILKVSDAMLECQYVFKWCSYVLT